MHGESDRKVSRQAVGNALAGVVFLTVAIVDFTRDSSGIGVVFLVFAAVFLGLGLSGRKTAAPENEWRLTRIYPGLCLVVPRVVPRARPEVPAHAPHLAWQAGCPRQESNDVGGEVEVLGRVPDEAIVACRASLGLREPRWSWC